MAQDSINLELAARETTGKAVKHLRTQGTVPAVVHDHGKASLVVQGDYQEIYKVWQQAGKHHPVNLKAAGKSCVALIKDAAFDPRKHLLTHVVFNAVNANEKVTAEIPVHAKYDEGNESSPAERAGFIVLAQLETVTVDAIASKLPDALYYDAEKLVEVGDHVTAADLIIPEGVELKTEAEHAIATVYEPSALAAANEDAGGDASEEDAESVASESGSVDDTEAAAEGKSAGEEV